MYQSGLLCVILNPAHLIGFTRKMLQSSLWQQTNQSRILNSELKLVFIQKHRNQGSDSILTLYNFLIFVFLYSMIA